MTDGTTGAGVPKLCFLLPFSSYFETKDSWLGEAQSIVLFHLVVVSGMRKAGMVAPWADPSGVMAVLRNEGAYEHGCPALQRIFFKQLLLLIIYLLL